MTPNQYRAAIKVMTMTTAEAIKQADAWVRMNHYGPGQYQVHHWSIKHGAWWQGQMSTHRVALYSRFTWRIALALELLGYDQRSAVEAAESWHIQTYGQVDWRKCVRDEMKADKLARSQEEQPA